MVLLQLIRTDAVKSVSRIWINTAYDWILLNRLKAGLIGLFTYLCARYSLLKFKRILYSYPPGPVGLPIIGYFGHKLLYLKYGYEQYANRGIAKRYGNMFMYDTFYHRPTKVIIASSKLAKQILSLKPVRNDIIASSRSAKHILSLKAHALNRPIEYPNTIDILSNDDGTRNLSALQHNKWVQRRKLVHTALIVMCTSSYVNQIIDSIMYKTVFPQIDETIHQNELWFPHKLFGYCAFNTIFHSSFGYSVEIDDRDCVELRQSIDDTFRAFENVKAVLWNLLTHYIAFGAFKAYLYPYKVVGIRKERCDLIRKLVQKREVGEYNRSKPVSFIDHMLNAVQSKRITRSELEADIGAIFAAGTDTTSSALQHAITFAAKFPKIQNRVQHELWNEFGETDSNDPDKIKFDISRLFRLPLFRAFIKEVLRVASVANAGLMHRASDDIWIEHDGKQYRIPKDAGIVYLISNVHYDSNENWVDASKNIVLENWLDDNGFFKANKSEMTFGHGYRDCVGKVLAMKELHIIIGYLLLNYRFVLDDPNTEIKTLNTGINVIHPEIGIRVYSQNQLQHPKIDCSTPHILVYPALENKFY
eukprot:719544_1